jgi:hypothetical protein
MDVRRAGVTLPVSVANGGTGGTTAQTASQGIGAAYILGASQIPFIHLSTGSVAANGAISAITALPRAYPKAYCYFPANILATVKAAGWYFCTFSTTTAGIAFLDSYTSGVPTVPSSPTAVTDGKGAFTGDTTERIAVSITVPANALGNNGQLHITSQWQFTNSAGTKTNKIRLGGAAGTIYFSENGATTSLSSMVKTEIGNVGVTNSQSGTSFFVRGSNAVFTTSPTVSSVDTTASTTVDFALLHNTATDNDVLEGFSILLMYGA